MCGERERARTRAREGGREGAHCVCVYEREREFILSTIFNIVKRTPYPSIIAYVSHLHIVFSVIVF
jgi:hypothetical protein